TSPPRVFPGRGSAGRLRSDSWYNRSVEAGAERALRGTPPKAGAVRPPGRLLRKAAGIGTDFQRSRAQPMGEDWQSDTIGAASSPDRPEGVGCGGPGFG